MIPEIGVCYYPEHWPEDMWEADAAEMVANGITWVRIGEFAWSLIEPKPAKFEWDWLDRVVEVLGKAGLKIVMGTPTATPPRWMLDQYPDMLALDDQGRPRGFGSRRHYCFSHAGYRSEAARIALAMGNRYGETPSIQAWQIDNEYGCHDTVLSYSSAASDAFRDWLAMRYQSCEALNKAWGTVFWSMHYDSFDQIDLPNLTVTEPAPAHVMDFRRFSSDQVALFNHAQAQALRGVTDAPLIHNYMGRVTEFDHFDCASDLDIASWDSYPIGFLSDRLDETPERKRQFLRQGDPDFQAFHHDLYRAVGAASGNRKPHQGRWWVMEQQPGPVNWAPYNPAPLPGMAGLWAQEAAAHGAEVISYFRWRQAPFGQEQMHAGLKRPDNAPAPALAEAKSTAEEFAFRGAVTQVQGQVALLFDYPSAWAWDTQPQGADFDYFELVFAVYQGLRRLGLSIDILPAKAQDYSGYAMVAAPGLFHIDASLMAALTDFSGSVLLGPRSNTRTADFAIPVPLPPGVPGLNATIAQTESLPPNAPIELAGGGALTRWFEHLEGDSERMIVTTSGAPALVHSGWIYYLAGWPDEAAMERILLLILADEGLEPEPLPDGLRLRQTARHSVWINYTETEQSARGVTVPPLSALWEPR